MIIYSILFIIIIIIIINYYFFAFYNNIIKITMNYNAAISSLIIDTMVDKLE